MTVTNNIFSNDCPIGHSKELINTGIKLPEGPLLICRECGHMVSSCSQKRYDLTMKQFDTAVGTLPNVKSVNRSFRWVVS